LCGLWADASCEDISKDHYKAIKMLSTVDNMVYYCHTNDCSSCIKYITNEWVKSRDSSKIEVVSNLAQQYISKEYQAIQKTVSDLSNKILHLQAQESDLCAQIKQTAVALDKQPDKTKTPPQDDKCNVVVYGH